MTMGILTVKGAELAKRVYFLQVRLGGDDWGEGGLTKLAVPSLPRPRSVQNAEGAGLAPFDCWLGLRGLKTMALRMERSADNCAKLAAYLSRHPLVKKVRWVCVLPSVLHVVLLDVLPATPLHHPLSARLMKPPTHPRFLVWPFPLTLLLPPGPVPRPLILSQVEHPLSHPPPPPPAGQLRFIAGAPRVRRAPGPGYQRGSAAQL